MTLNVYWDDVKEGQKIPTWSRKTDFMNWNRYAAVNDEFVYIHMDDEAGRAALNQPGAFGMGNLRWAYLHNMLRDWAGDEAWVVSIGCQFRAINNKNDVLTCEGTVTKKYEKDGMYLVDLELNVANQKDEKTAPGQATVALPTREGNQKLPK